MPGEPEQRYGKAASQRKHQQRPGIGLRHAGGRHQIDADAAERDADAEADEVEHQDVEGDDRGADLGGRELLDRREGRPVEGAELEEAQEDLSPILDIVVNLENQIDSKLFQCNQSLDKKCAGSKPFAPKTWM